MGTASLLSVRVPAEEAAAFLGKVGVDLGDLDSRVDEERFVQALNRFGLSLTTSNPDRDMNGRAKSGMLARVAGVVTCQGI